MKEIRLKLHRKSNRLLTVIVVIICTLTVIMSGCKKDEKEKEEEAQHKIVGTWLFSDMNFIFYYTSGGTFNAKEEGKDLSEWREYYLGLGWRFIFEKNGVVSIEYNEFLDSAPYTVSNDKITIKNGTDIVFWYYRVSEGTLVLISRRSIEEIFEEIFGDDELMEMYQNVFPDNLSKVEDVDLEMTLTKVD
ncbi:MAG: hypothetical protein LBG80_20830 [Bacteroidales bacterium]|jgi:hypothetical protein|nr:hypothetical protein [Bacteroidales bacterium]